MIESVFNEIIKEARESKITFNEENEVRIIRTGFNLVESSVSNDLPNFYINDKSLFYKLLNEYTCSALEFYGLDRTYNNIKKVLSFVWSNITKKEMHSIENFINKYINFINDDILCTLEGKQTTSLGDLKFFVDKQSIMQETPYCFKSYFEKEEAKEIARYSLPRISFGISDNVCYIYAIQNKDSIMNTNSKYNLEVKNKMRTINSGINKYRNVTPSFVISLSLFLSFLKKNSIFNIKIETPLLIRQNNRQLVTDYKIKVKTQSAFLSKEDLEKFKEEIINKKILDDYNSTVKFVNCFNRLKIHFDNIYLSSNSLNNDIILDIINLTTKNEFLSEIANDEILIERRKK